MSYKEECLKRLEYTNKYSKYSQEDLIEEIIEKDKEIEKQYEEKQTLIKGIVEEYHTKDTKEIERLNNIIKEVREYINKNTKWYDELLGIVEMHGYNTDRIPIIYVDELLEILDKGE